MDKKFLTIFLIPVIFLSAPMAPKIFGDELIKKPNVSGQFYEASSLKLAEDVDRFVSAAEVPPQEDHVEMIIVPHAGYVYSGAVAGYGFKAVQQEKYKTIVILAPSHFYGFDGISVWPKGGFETPLGVAAVDEEFTQKLLAVHKKIYFDKAAFQKEHSLEVEIPFVQRTFKNVKIVPVIIGQTEPQILDEFTLALKQIVGSRKDVLIVVSTDLSHYHDDQTARHMDKMAIDAILTLNPQTVWQLEVQKKIEMCGFMPVIAALLYAHHQGLNKAELLKYANSADVSGDRDRVVGYSAIKIYKTEGEAVSDKDNLTIKQKKELLQIAKNTVEKFVSNKTILEPKTNDPMLKKITGAFVTLHKKGALRGCIGNIIGKDPLYVTVRNMAIAAASQDPRFEPVTKEELKDVDVEVSVLSVPRKIKNVDEIVMGTHGVIISHGSSHGVFLPQVATETGWSKEEFLSQLCAQKAGLPADAWKDPQTQIEIFTADVFSEADIR